MENNKSGSFTRSILILFSMVLLVMVAVPPVFALVDCPSGCSCLLPADAKQKGYNYCSGQQQVCGYEQTTQQAMYCYGSPTQPTCPSGCECLSEAAAKNKFGSYVKCSDTACGYEQTAAALIPRYCVKQGPTIVVTVRTITPVSEPVCPAGCSCMQETEAKAQFGMYTWCSEEPCASAVTGSANINAYCFKKTEGGVCPSGCDCMSEATAKQKFGVFTKCSETICGYEPSATAAAANIQIPRYCIRTAVTSTVTSGFVCPQGCKGMSAEDAQKAGYPLCRGVQTPYGYDSTKRQLFCYEIVPSSQCMFDYQKNACSGSCSQGYSCSLVYSAKDATGKVSNAICDCIPPPQPGCGYSSEKNACTGTCPNGGQCAKLGTGQSTAANTAAPICGCQNAACYFDYSLDKCVGTCAVSGQNCQINTWVADPVTGKTAYAQCHCKGEGELPQVTGLAPPSLSLAQTTPQQPAGIPCGCDPKVQTCTGSCPQDQICFMTATSVDNSGKNICSGCECKAVCREDPQTNQCTGFCPQNGACQMFKDRDAATGAEKISCGCSNTGAAPGQPVVAPAPDIFTAIANFFRSLFGIK